MDVKRARVKAVRRLPPPAETFNVSVADTHNYFAGGILTHNCDDLNNPTKVESEADRARATSFWKETLPSRLNDQDHGVKIVVQQRVHEKDVAGEAIAMGWRACVFPMEFDPDAAHRDPRDPRTEKGESLWPARFSLPALAKLKNAMGAYAWAGQYNQNPIPREGGMFEAGWFPIEDAAPAEVWHSTVRAWDLAATIPKDGSDPDWSCSCKTAKDSIGRVWVLDATWMRESPASVDMAIRALAKQDGPQNRTRIPQDPGQAGVFQAQAIMRAVAPHHIEAVRPTGTKEARARGLASQAQAGNVILLRGLWNKRFIEELCGFPNLSHDDMVDAASDSFHGLYGEGFGIFDAYRQALAEHTQNMEGSSFTTQRIATASPGYFPPTPE